MNIYKLVGVISAAVVVAVGLAGCSNFWQAPASSTTTTTTTLSGNYFFVLDEATAQVITYNIVSGTLTQVSETALPSTPTAMAIAPNGDWMAVATAGGIYAYPISGGVLGSSVLLSTDIAQKLAIDGTSTWILEASSVDTVLSTIEVDSATAPTKAAASGNSISIPSSTVNQMAFTTNNNYVFVAMGTSGTYEYSFNTNSTSATIGSVGKHIALVGTSALTVAVDPSDRLIYIGETAAKNSSGGLRAFAYTATSNTLAELSGSPYSSGGSGPYAILPKLSGDYVYVGNTTGSTSAGNITGFSVTASSSSYTLAKLSSSTATGIRPKSLAEEKNGNILIAACEAGTPNLEAYIFDTSTAGALDSVISSSSFAANAVLALP